MNSTNESLGGDTVFWTSAAASVGAIVALALSSRSEKSVEPEEAPEGYKAHNEKEQAAIDKYDKDQELSWIPWLLKSFRGIMTTYIVLVHLVGLFALPKLLECKWETLAAFLPMYICGGLGITGGAHRLWAHKSYKGALPYRFLMMVFNSMANQGTIYHWSRDHRTHHKYSETKADPHNAIRGFFFSHAGWLFVKKDPRVKFAGERLSMEDLKQMPEVMLQKRLDPLWNLFWCFAFPGIVSLSWGEDFGTGVLILGFIRYVITLHATWAVNSFAHLYGETPYDESANPAENPYVSIFAIGEGWHSWHHAFPTDYAASEFGVSAQFNPTKLWIDTWAKLGLVWDRKRSDQQWESRMKRKGIKDLGAQGPMFFKVRTIEATDDMKEK